MTDACGSPLLTVEARCPCGAQPLLLLWARGRDWCAPCWKAAGQPGPDAAVRWKR